MGGFIQAPPKKFRSPVNRKKQAVRRPNQRSGFARLGAMALGAAINTPWGQKMGGHVGITSKGNGIVVTGTDFVAAVPYTAAVAVGDNIYSLGYSVGAISTSRLAQFSKLYEFYKVEALAFHFESVMPTSFGGAYIHYFDYDPTDTGVTASAGLQNAMGHLANKAGKWYESSTLIVPPNPAPRQALECSAPDSGVDDSRDYMFGRYYLLSSSALPAPASATTLGNVFVTYRIHLYNPAYHTAAGAGLLSTTATGSLNFPQYTSAAPKGIPFNRQNADGTASVPLCKYSDTSSVYDIAQTVSQLAGNVVAFAGTVVAARRAVRELIGANGTTYNEGVMLQAGAYRWTTRFFTVNNSGQSIGFGYSNGASNDNVFLKLEILRPDFTTLTTPAEAIAWSSKLNSSFLFRRIMGQTYPIYGCAGEVCFRLKKAAFVFPVVANDNNTSADNIFGTSFGADATKWCVKHQIDSISDVDIGEKVVYDSNVRSLEVLIPPTPDDFEVPEGGAVAPDCDEEVDLVSVRSDSTKSAQGAKCGFPPPAFVRR